MLRTIKFTSGLRIIPWIKPKWSKNLSTAPKEEISQVDTLLPPHLQGKDKVFPTHIESIVDSISKLTLLEVADLNELLRKRLNIEAPMHGMSFMPATMSQPISSEVVEEEQVSTKTSFTVKLMKFDAAKKVALIKEIKTIIPDMNLVQAKKFVEAAPGVLKSDLSKDEADAMKKTLESCGASVEIE